MSRIPSPTSALRLESGLVRPRSRTPVACLNGSRYAALALTVLVSIAMLSCQEYSSGLQRSVQRADETAAVAALHTVGMAQQTYSLTGGDFGTFQQLCAGGLLDPRFDSSNPAIQDYSAEYYRFPNRDQGHPRRDQSFPCKDWSYPGRDDDFPDRDESCPCRDESQPCTGSPDPCTGRS